MVIILFLHVFITVKISRYNKNIVVSGQKINKNEPGHNNMKHRETLFYGTVSYSIEKHNAVVNGINKFFLAGKIHQ